jgi:hypothetical protein
MYSVYHLPSDMIEKKGILPESDDRKKYGKITGTAGKTTGGFLHCSRCQEKHTYGRENQALLRSFCIEFQE